MGNLKSFKKVLFICLVVVIAIAASASYGITLKNSDKICSVKLENVEALARVEIGGQYYMTSQEISDKMNTFSGILWQEYWTPCFITLSVKTTSSAGGITVGAMYYTVDAVANLQAAGVSYIVLVNQPGQKKYCPDGGGFCWSRDCM